MSGVLSTVSGVANITGRLQAAASIASAARAAVTQAHAGCDEQTQRSTADFVNEFDRAVLDAEAALLKAVNIAQRGPR